MRVNSDERAFHHSVEVLPTFTVQDPNCTISNDRTSGQFRVGTSVKLRLTKLHYQATIRVEMVLVIRIGRV